MKFWQKIFLGTMIVFIIAFDAGAFFLTSQSYDFMRERETESAIREQSVILSSVANRIANAEKIYPDAPKSKERLRAVIEPLAEYYLEQGVRLALFNGGAEIYADMQGVDEEMLDLKDAESKKVADRTVGDVRYLLISSGLPDYPDLVFVYARDISGLDTFRSNVSRAFWLMSAVVLVLLGVSVYLLLRRMTRPIRELDRTAAGIAGGAYEKRAFVDSGDELGRLGESFNRMADSVEENIAALTKTAEDKQEFIDDLTHEIKTPMTSILGYAEYLRNAKSSEEERIAAAENLCRAARRLEALSAKLSELTLLRGETIALATVNIPALFEALSDLMRPDLDARGLKLVTRADAVAVAGDETLLLSALANLTENAARASKAGDEITVSSYDEGFSEEDSSVVIEVTDHGRGVKQEELERITAPFYRVDKSRSRAFGGMGLGLSIVERIVRLHCAKLEIASREGKGTTARIHFTSR
jgi:signal transduction histidine kinase